MRAGEPLRGAAIGRPGRRWPRCAAALLAACFLVTTAPGVPEEPVPLKRVVLPPERIPEEMKRLGQGELKQLSRDDFEGLVRRAGEAARASRKQPRLAEARYRARVVNGDLVGSAQWQIAGAGTSPALLPLAPFNLALRRPRLGQKPAVIGDLEGQGPELLLEQPEDQTFAFDWSARGERRPEGLAFALEVPACPLASLEVDAPADQAVSVASDGCLLSGPGLADSADRRRWRVEFAGRSQVRLLVNKAEGPGGRAALVLATQTTRQRVTPDAVEAVFEFDLKVLHQPVHELRCECDPSLRPYQVLAGAPSEDAPHPVEAWQFQPGAGAAPGVLTVRLAEPFQGGTLQVRALAPLGAAGAVRWQAPWVRLAGAVPRGETLELRLSPDLHVEDWHAGGFRLTQARTEEGWQVLTLAGGALADGPGAGRPGARVRACGAEYRAHELLWWRVVPPSAAADGPADRQPSLTAQIRVEVVRGRLFQLPLALPPGWQADRVQLNPADLLRGSSTRAENGRTVLTVELQRPVSARGAADAPRETPSAPDARATPGSVRLTIGLRPSVPPRPPAAAGTTYPFPDVAPLGATWREGGLALDCNEGLYEAQIQTAAPAGAAEEEGPWGKQPPEYFYPYRGRPVQGSLVLRPRAAHLRARCTSAVGLTADRVAVRTRLVLEPEAGTPGALDLLVSAPLTGAWQWRTEGGGNAVQGFERVAGFEAAPLLLPLAASRPLGAAALLAAVARPEARPHVQRWRLTLSRPLRAPLALEATYEVPRDGGGAEGTAVDVPLLTVPAASRMEGEVKLYLSGSSLVQVEARGLQEQAAPAAGAGAAPPWRVFRYSAVLPGMRLRGRGPAVSLAPGPAVEAAHLTTYAGTDGQLLQHYRFQVWNWQQRTFPVRLPGGARLLAARVDGRQVGGLAPPPADATDGAAPAAELPVPAGATRHTYEVLYALRQPRWHWWADVDTGEPALPLDVRAAACRHTWFLPPGVVPLDGSASRLPGFPDAPGTVGAWAGQAAAAWRRWGPPRWLGASARAAGAAPWQIEQRQRLADAALEAAKPGPDAPLTLGGALERLELAGSQGPNVLVLDGEALRQAGLTPATPLPPPGAEPFWEGAGLVCVPCPPAPVLTTRRQAQLWQAAAQGDGSVHGLAPAAAEAVLAGHDRSGRFRRVEDWVRSSSLETAAAGATAGVPLLPEPLGPGWTAWEPAAGNPGPLRVVRQDALTLAGVVLGVLFALALARGRRRSAGWCLAVLVLGLGGSLVALLWLPPALDALGWWPLLAGLALALPWYLRWVFRPARARRERGSRTPRPGSQPARALPGPGAVATLVLVLLPAACALLPARAAPQQPAVVFLLPGPPDAPDRSTVLAPPRLLEQLEALARRGHPAPHGAVLTAADYQATVSDGVAHFTATLSAQAFQDGPASLTVPLSDVQLEEASVDGARAAPQTAPGAAGGYVLPVQGKGAHSIVLRFQAPVQTAGADCDVRLTAPRLVENRLTVQAPAGARYLQVPTRQGAATLDTSGTRLEADLGQVGVPLHFHWRQDTAQAPTLRVEELYLWELSPAAGSLSAVLRYAVTGGPVDGVAVELPAQLDVRGVEVAPYGGEESKPRLRDWYLLGPPAEDQPHRLQLEFRSPVTAGVQVLLDLVPRRPVGARAVLPLPTPLGAETTAGYLAYRLDGLREVEKSFLRVKPVEPEEFLRRWKQAPVNPPPDLAYAGQLGRRPAAPLEITLALQPPRCDATQDLDWRVGPEGADLRATLRLAAPDGDLALVEWEVPESVTVTRVAGPDVLRWGRSGAHLQVWLQRTTRAAEVQLAGWWLPPAAAGGRKPGASPLPYTLDLPHLWLPAARAQTTAVHLTAGNGLTLTRLRTRHLDSWPDAGPSDQDLSFLSRQHQYGGSFEVRAAAAGADVRVLTVAELRDRQLAFVSRVECRGGPGELHTITVRLRNGDGTRVRLQDAPEIAQVREQGLAPSGRSWTVDLRPGTTGPVRLTLTGSLPLDEAAGGVPMPDVSVDGPRRPESWVAVAGPELAAEDARGLAPEPGGGAFERAWPDEAARLRGGRGSVWRVATPAGEWGLRLRPRRRAVAAAAVRVFLSEQAAAVADGRHWTHQASYWLYHEASTDLRVTLPEGAVVLGASVDGTAITLLQPAAGSAALWLPLPGGTGARAVSLRWAYAAGSEPADRPNLEAPRLDGATQEGPVLWKVEVPTGYYLEAAAGADQTRPASPAGQDLRRAEAQLRLAEVLGRQAQGPGDVLTWQRAAARRRFQDFCRYAGRWLASAPPPPSGAEVLRLNRDENRAALVGALVSDRGPEGQGLGEWLGQLRERERQLGPVSTGPEAALPGEAEPPAPAAASGPAPGGERAPGPSADALPECGTPLCWHADADGAPPSVRLVAAPVRQARRAAAGSLLLLALLLLVWLLSFLPAAQRSLRAFGPEQLLLWAVLAWLLTGLPWLALALLLLGAGARLFRLVGRVVGWLSRPAPAAGAPGAATPG